MKTNSSRLSHAWVPWVAALGLAPASRANAVPIYGGPTYDSTTGNGFYSTHANVTAGEGMAVGYSEKYESGISIGFRAVRWDASGTAATELGNLGYSNSGYTNTFAFAINAAGTMVGLAYKYRSGIEEGNRAVRWDASGTAAIELGNLGTALSGYADSGASAINADGTAVGAAKKYESGIDKGYRAARWDASGTTATELGNLGTDATGVTYSYPYAIGAKGTAVGLAEKYESGIDKGQRAVRWDASGTTATELGNLGTDPSGITDCYAIAVNVAGTALGYSEKYESGIDKGQRVVRWDASGAATELGNLGVGRAQSSANAINTAGTAVGSASKWEQGIYKGRRAVRWDASGTTATELGNLGTDSEGSATCYALAINAAGTAVGSAANYVPSPPGPAAIVRGSGPSEGASVHSAVAWGLDGLPLDLNTLIDPGSGWVNLYEANSISDTNWVTGYGSFDPDGPVGLEAYSRMFLMQVPEPASLLLIALASCLPLRRRQKRS